LELSADQTAQLTRWLRAALIQLECSPESKPVLSNKRCDKSWQTRRFLFFCNFSSEKVLFSILPYP
jgi:hypothetical protein